MKILRLSPALAVCVLALVPGASALAQPDTTMAPTYGSVSLSSGFSPDPHVVDIVVGGEFNAADTASGCVGYVAASPDFSLEYTEEEYALSILVVAGSDTTLMVNDPDGSWFCNDDTTDLDGSNPGVYFGSPKSGRYDIWVGGYSTENNYVNAQLVISEQGTENWRTIASSLGSVNTSSSTPSNSTPVSSTTPRTGTLTPAPPRNTPPPTSPRQQMRPAEGVIQYGRKN